MPKVYNCHHWLWVESCVRASMTENKKSISSQTVFLSICHFAGAVLPQGDQKFAVRPGVQIFPLKHGGITKVTFQAENVLESSGLVFPFNQTYDWNTNGIRFGIWMGGVLLQGEKNGRPFQHLYLWDGGFFRDRMKSCHWTFALLSNSLHTVSLFASKRAKELYL